MSDAMGPVRVLAPAKLTLSLRVTGVRQDGFHELDAEMVSLDLADELMVSPGHDGLEVVLDGVSGPVEGGATNLVARALGALGRPAGVRLVKRIPIGGGLGGGSSDAAAVLRWAGCDDLALAARIGADVPFCVRGGRARVRGIGERVEPLADEERAFVLLVPPLAVDTAAVYRAFDELDAGGRLVGTEGGNDLTAPALQVAPELGRWRACFAEATGAEPRLAGSGATWFVEGTIEELGLSGTAGIEMDGRIGRLIAARTVTAAYGAVESVG